MPTDDLTGLIAHLSELPAGARVAPRVSLAATFGVSQRRVAALLAEFEARKALRRGAHRVLYRSRLAAPKVTAGDVIDAASRGVVGSGSSNWLYASDVTDGTYRWRKYHLRRPAMVKYVNKQRAKSRTVTVTRCRITGMFEPVDA